MEWLTKRPIAHRALHDLSEGRAENSLSAFKAAVDAGYAIECDLQVSKTGEPVVFHDPTLERMTGITGNVRDKTPEELAKIRLLETEDHIYTLAHHLEAVGGKVPIVLELKGLENEDAGFVEGVAKAVSGYNGPLAVMSFDHWVCKQFKPLMPDLPRGLTAEGDESVAGIHKQAVHDFDLNFISYGIKHIPTPFVADMKEVALPIITWTVRTLEQAERTYTYADQVTFEGFLPEIENT